MSESSKFSISQITRRFNPGIAEFEALFNFLPHAALVVDAQSLRIEVMNNQAAELTAYQPNQLRNVTIPSLLPSWDQLKPISDSLSSWTASGESLAIYPNVELIKQDGSDIEVNITLRPLPPRGKQVLVVIRRMAESEQKQKAAVMNGVMWSEVQGLLDAMQQPDLDLALQKILQAGQALSGASILGVYIADHRQPSLQLKVTWGEENALPEQLTAQDLIHLSQPQLWQPGKRSISSLHRIARANKHRFVASAPLGQPEAGIGLVVATDRQKDQNVHLLPVVQLLANTITTVIQNQSQIARTRQNLEELEQAFILGNSIEATIEEGILVADPNLKAVRINAAAEKMLGYTTQEVQGQPVERILIGTEMLRPALEKALLGYATYDQANLRLYRRNGDAFLAHVDTIPVLLSDGQVGSILVFIQDLSEQEQAREQARQLEQRAMLGEVTAVFAHEVRNPINNISTGLQLMAIKLPPGDPNQEVISRLEQDCDRLAELMKSVLAFSKPADYIMEPVDLGVLLKLLLERLQPRMSRSNVQHILQVEPGCSLIDGNLRALEQVFTNLIHNAVQAMGDKGGQIAIKVNTLEQEGWPYVEVSVADTGPGIPKEIQDRIFQPFFTTHQSGTGLGLAISKRIITAHKGNIRLNSFPGGTVFSIQFPAASQ